MKSKPLDMPSLLNQCLHQLQDRASVLVQLQQAVQADLDPVLQPHCQVANLRNGVLVVSVSSAVWLTRLQYQRLELLSALRAKGFPMLTSIEFKVNPTQARINLNHQKKNTNQISAVAAEHLQDLAENVGGELGDKLKKLAALAKRPT